MTSLDLVQCYVVCYITKFDDFSAAVNRLETSCSANLFDWIDEIAPS